MRDQRIRDPIHNLIKFSATRQDEEVLWQLVQTSEFQRLRRIRQLGFSELVYPGATHTRFSHALGAMQMARKMLAIFLRNEIVGHDADHETWQRATLCAALLHDIGHGPFSHVFEAVSAQAGVKFHHEEWTRKIIAETSISRVLEAAGGDLRDRTLSFFKKEPGYNVYSSIVSSQLDADRLDFLMRDRYYTGIHFGAIDPEWILDCLYVDDVPVDAESEETKQSFIVKSKGLPAVENFLYAYSELYSRVYFHKTTRAAQIMLQEIMKGIVTNPQLLNALPTDSPVRCFFEAKPEPSVDLYLKLDDYSLWNLVMWAASNDCGEFTPLAQRLIQRDLYKCYEPPHEPGKPPNPIKVTQFQTKLKERGITFSRDQIPEKGYQSFQGGGMVLLKNILVFSDRDNAPCALSGLSALVENMPGTPATRFYFRTPADREAAGRLWD